jgi:hypothetical protein
VKRSLSIVLLLLVAAAAARTGVAEEKAKAPGKRYLLLLLEDGRYRTAPDSEPRARIDECRRWSRSTPGVETGDKLSGTGWKVSAGEASAFSTDLRKGFVAGLFVVAAPGDEEALRIARSCPHLAHGGEIELRPIE